MERFINPQRNVCLSTPSDKKKLLRTVHKRLIGVSNAVESREISPNQGLRLDLVQINKPY